MGKFIALIAVLILFACAGVIVADDQNTPSSPWGPGIKVEPAPGAPSPPSAQPTPPAVQPAPTPQATPEQPATQPSAPSTKEQPITSPAPPSGAVKPPEAPSDNTQKAKELIQKGRLLWAKKQFEESLKSFEEAEKLDPTLPEASFGVGFVLLSMGKTAEAIDPLERAKKLKPDEYNISLSLGKAYMDIGQTDKSIEAYREAIKLKPMLEGPRDSLIQIYMVSEKWTDALALLDETIKLNTFNARRYILRGDVYLKLGKPTEATADYKKALEIHPGSTDAIIGIAQAQLQTKKYKAAMDTVAPILRDYPENVKARLVRASALILSGKVKEGVAEVDIAIKKGGNDFDVLFDAAQCLIEAKLNDRAIEALNGAAKVNPKSIKPHEALATLYDQMGKKAEANAERAKIKELSTTK